MTTADLALQARAHRRPVVEPLLVAGALALAYLIVQPVSADLAAQVYRTDVFREFGFAVWNGQWYGGHHMLGYSVLFPPLGALLGPRLVGALSAVAAAVIFERLTYARWGSRARLGAIWFGAATATNLFTGRLTFALGVAVGLASLLAVQRRHGRLAILLAATSSLASPVAGLFVALAGVADGVASRRRLSFLVAGSAFAVAAALAVAFPEGGVEPFVVSSFWPTIAFAVIALVLIPREERAIRYGVAFYAVACTAAFLINTPMGGNAVRLGTLVGGPLLACALWNRRGVALALLALPLLYWQWMPPVRDVADASGDPSVEARYYMPLNTFLTGAQPTGRIEITPTRNHWETVHVARRFSLARGWERQLDIKYNPLFYKARLTSADYRAWLSDNSVQYVAIPQARLDYAATAEASLVRGGLSYLVPVWGNADWRVYRYTHAVPVVSGPARLVSLRPTGFTLRAQRAAVVDTRIRYTTYWKLVAGTGCVEQGAGGLTRLIVQRPGIVRVAADFAPDRLVSDGPRCRNALPR